MRCRKRLRDDAAIGVVEGKGEEAVIVAAVLAFAETRADDHRTDRGLLEHPARCHVGNRHGMLRRDRSQRPEQSLEDLPAADRVDEALVFHGAPIGDLAFGRLGLVEPLLAEETAGKRAIGEKLDPLAATEGRSCPRPPGDRAARSRPGWWRP